MGNELEPLKI